MNQYFHVAFTQRNKVSHLNYNTHLRGDEIIYLAKFSGCQNFYLIHEKNKLFTKASRTLDSRLKQTWVEGLIDKDIHT